MLEYGGSGDSALNLSYSGDKLIPVVSVNNSEIEGLASLSVSAFILRLVCTNGMVSKTEISAS